MPRIAIPMHDDPSHASRPVLDAIRDNLGFVPNVFRLIANSPEVLTCFAAFQAGLAGTLGAKTRARIALAVAQVNGSDYCLSAHSYLGLNRAGLSAEEIKLNRHGTSGDTRAHAAVDFAAKVARERGRVSGIDIARVREAGFSDAEVVEIVALVAENVFTNFLNEVARTEIDFPVVAACEAA
ncbi:carboxymuconolactone decarboxylase family protein [Stappia sp.]|uniref:carboxymuconolactone decarboxylase family protein n=1 Tax=Stappia sp. TaxID=1870903 RepID=UPI003A99E987